MIPFSDTLPVIGETAAAWLSHVRRGKVLASVTNAAYLLSDTGELVWLGDSGSPHHARSLHSSLPLPCLPVDSTFTVRKGSLSLASGGSFDFCRARVWRSTSPVVGNAIEPARLPDQVFSFFDTFLERESPVGFGFFIPPLLRMARVPACTPSFQPDDLTARAAWPPIEGIARACLAHDLPGVFQHADALVGLGSGLTPSGDDFLGGLFFARHLLTRTYPHLLYLEFSDLPRCISAAQSRTNLISFVLLRDNAFGHALDPLHRLGTSLLTDQSISSTASAASELIKVGHSTGWSLLAGFLAGIMLAFDTGPVLPCNS